MVDNIVSKSITKKIAISGGGPLLQFNAALELFTKLRLNNFNIKALPSIVWKKRNEGVHMGNSR
jgi:pyruvate-formate lyase-activating enzyme